MNRIKFLAVALNLILFLGCSGTSSAPSEANGRAFLERKIQEQSGGAIRLVNFNKVNATASGPLFGLEFQAEIEFLKDGAWAKGNRADPHVSFKYSPGKVGTGFTEQMAADLDGWQNVQKGQHQNIKDAVLFEKTERGWRTEDGQVY
jgi:hypothetical protein